MHAIYSYKPDGRDKLIEARVNFKLYTSVIFKALSLLGIMFHTLTFKKKCS